MVGNSSSGLYEAPSLHTPTLDIGTRQQGRCAVECVQHAPERNRRDRAYDQSMLRHPAAGLFQSLWGRQRQPVALPMRFWRSKTRGNC